GRPTQAGHEDGVQIYPRGANPGKWNDLSCTSSGSKSVIEVNLCPVTNVTAPITLCQEQSASIGVTSTILGSAPYTYTWDNGSSQTSQTVTPMDTTKYVVTTQDRYNCQVKDTVTVNV